MKDLIDCCSSKDAVVLDFFAGTGTTAQAVYELNRTTNANRKVILIEQPQPINETHIAKKNGFSTTADITEFRLAAIHKSNPTFNYSVFEI